MRANGKIAKKKNLCVYILRLKSIQAQWIQSIGLTFIVDMVTKGAIIALNKLLQRTATGQL